jgi:hypothetical protein
VKDTTQAREESQNQIECRFVTRRYKRDDPKKLVGKHSNQVVSHWPYLYDDLKDKIFTENDLGW